MGSSGPLGQAHGNYLGGRRGNPSTARIRRATVGTIRSARTPIPAGTIVWPRNRTAWRVWRKAYVIHTTTTANPISDASLTLRSGPAGRGVHTQVWRRRTCGNVPKCRMRTRGAAWTASASAAIQPAPSPVAVPLRALGDELQVRSALHRIGADLGEPVDVRREGAKVIVMSTGLGPRAGRPK